MYKLVIVIIIFVFTGCAKDLTEQPQDDCVDTSFFSEYNSRNFYMGFSTWAYAPSITAVENTYSFIAENSDIYSEHIDYKIPWNAWINNLPLPAEFVNEIDSRVSHKIPNIKLALSVSLLNTMRNELAEDFDGSIPDYNFLDDIEIEDAYFKHIDYLISRFNPNYLIIAIEVNELKINKSQKWDGYKQLIGAVKNRIKTKFPNLLISESFTLHNLYNPDVENPELYISEMVSYANNMDFVAISYYPFFKGQHSKADFQKAFDFLHEKINKPIAFSETSHLAMDLSVDSYSLFITGNECEQNLYLETLLTNAQKQNYEYVVWWAHRDFYELWATFPEEMKDIGKLWRNTGLLTDDGSKRKACKTWQNILQK